MRASMYSVEHRAGVVCVHAWQASVIRVMWV